MKRAMNFWVVGGDLRQAALARLLAEDGHTVHTFALERAEGVTCETSLEEAARADCVVLPLPASGERGRLSAPLSDEACSLTWVLDFLRPGQLVCAGMVSRELAAAAEQRDLELRDYFAREELAVANAVPAAAGIGPCSGPEKTGISRRGRRINSHGRDSYGLQKSGRLGAAAPSNQNRADSEPVQDWLHHCAPARRTAAAPALRHSNAMKGGSSTPLRVAAYCRVSTAREDQAGSLQSQQRYFRQCIEAHPNWVLTEIYADEGVSGTSTRGREAFNRMLAAAQSGALDLILTKEVSRFARNTVDALEITRRLKALGVGVVFLSDNIDTRDNDGELRLTIMASIAQEESRKTSERVRWGQRRRMEAGVVFGSDSMFGFDLRGGRLTVNQEQAPIVRRIYSKFLHEGKGTHVIARELDQEGIPPPGGGAAWSCTMVRRVLRNEKYAGDLLQKKYVTVDFLNHKKVENKGLEEKIYLPSHHEAIIDRETWQAAQRELARRAGRQAEGSKYSNRYWCSGKIVCGACGGRFTPRTDRRRDGSSCRAWHCRNGCGMRTLNEKALTACAGFVLRLLEPDGEGLIRELQEELAALRLRPETAPVCAAEAEQAALRQKKRRALDAFLDGAITRDELAALREDCDQALARLERRIQAAEQSPQARSAGLAQAEQALRAALEGADEVFAQIIDGITVFRDFIDVRVECVPAEFRLWHASEGRGKNYTTKIDRWEQIG